MARNPLRGIYLVMNDDFVDEDGPQPAKVPLAVAGILLLVAVGGAVDLAFDAPPSWLSAHVLFELSMMTVSLSLAVYLLLGWRRTLRSLESTRRTLLQNQASIRAERDQWRASAQAALEGLGAAIDRQFDAWKLTPTEREVALFLLKGYGHKQIAGTTNRSERTVRQHAVAVYQKSGLSGRAELAAFFLEDLLLPRS
jgi:DNA-binding CsgD family transcriptional regulator